MSLPSFRDVPAPDPKAMRKAGCIAARTHERLRSMIEPGASTLELDRAAEAVLREKGAEPAFRAYADFGHTLSVAINDELIHASPAPDRTLEDGDVVSVDLGARWDGHYSDTAVTYTVGSPSDARTEALVRRTRSALRAGIMRAVAGNTLEDVGRALEEGAGEFGNVTGWAGHFIGRRLHLAPQVFSRPHLNEHLILEEGMCLAIEPIYTLSADAETTEESPGGTVRTRTRAIGAHFEHTVRVHEKRVEILTARSDEPRFL